MKSADDVDVEEIKNAIRAAPDNASVTAAASHYAVDIAALKMSRKAHHKTMAIQIQNLGRYRRWQVSTGRKDL